MYPTTLRPTKLTQNIPLTPNNLYHTLCLYAYCTYPSERAGPMYEVPEDELGDFAAGAGFVDAGFVEPVQIERRSGPGS
jgi:hypothetical protein